MSMASAFDWDKDYSLEELLQSVIAIKEFPNRLAKVMNGLQEDDFVLTYREGGWNIRRIIHHLADSHMNGFIRTKHVIHQDQDEIQLYNQDAWGSSDDGEFHQEASFMILLGLHQRWSLLLLECLKKPEEYLALSIKMPGRELPVSLGQLIALYAWHGEHHLEQIVKAVSSKEQD